MSALGMASATARARAAPTGSSAPATTSVGTRDGPKPVVQGLHRALAGATERCCEASDGVPGALSVDAVASSRRQAVLAREQWVRLPCPEERLQPVVLQAGRELVVGGVAGRALVGIGKARRRALEEQARDDVPLCDCHPQGDAGTQRVADDDRRRGPEPAQDRGDVASLAFDGVSSWVGWSVGAAVAQEVDDDRGVPRRVDGGKVRRPVGAAAGEPVDEQDRRPIAGRPDLVPGAVHGGGAHGTRASVATRAAARCSSTFRARSVGSSRTFSPGCPIASRRAPANDR